MKRTPLVAFLAVFTGGEMMGRQMIQSADIGRIPAGTPHPLFAGQGKEFTYFVFKVAAQ